MSTLNAGIKFPPELVTEMFDKTKGHSALAKLSGQTPIAFAGNTIFTFSVDGEVSVVGEGGKKPAGSATAEPVQIKPIKIIYQARVTDEFLKCADEKRMEHLRHFAEGFAKKIARGIDITAIHGVNPSTKEPLTSLADKCFDGVVTEKIAYSSTTPDENIDDAVGAIQTKNGEISGVALSPDFASKLGKMKTTAGVYLYPEYRFGKNPETFDGLGSDVNGTVSFVGTDKAIVGDFANAFKWGFAEDVTFDVIEYGDPDQTGRDLKAYNEVLLRSEAYIGFGILDKDSFALVTDQTVSA